jgi:hypothetical protein
LKNTLLIDEDIVCNNLKKRKEACDKLKIKIDDAISRQQRKNISSSLYHCERKEFEMTVVKFNEQFKSLTCYPLGEEQPFWFLHFDDIFSEIFEPGQKYRILASVAKKINDKNPNRYICNIERIVPISIYDAYRSLFNKKEILERNRWERPLRWNERQEQNRNESILQEKIRSLEEQEKQTSINKNKLLAAALPLDKILQDFSRLGVQSVHSVPSSMSFVQNRDYHGAHRYFVALKQLLGLDGNAHEALERLEQMGVAGIPKVYERWCLLQVIKALTEDFGFTSTKNWKEGLLAQMVGAGKKDNIQLKFIVPLWEG